MKTPTLIVRFAIRRASKGRTGGGVYDGGGRGKSVEAATGGDGRTGREPDGFPSFSSVEA